MIRIGQFNTLRVIKEVPFGIYLDGDDLGEILLPNKVVPKGTQVNDLLIGVWIKTCWCPGQNNNVRWKRINPTSFI